MSSSKKAPDIDKISLEQSDTLQLPAEDQTGGIQQLENISFTRKILARWERLINKPDLGFEETRKRRLFSILILPGICILLVFASYHLTHDNIAEGIFDLIAGLWLIITLFGFQIIKKGLNLYRFNAVLLGCLFLFLSIKGGVHGNKLMWSFSFPLITFYTLGKKEGFISSVVLYILVIGVLYLPMSVVHVYDYPPEFKIRFCVIFFLVASLSYIYESVREYSQKKMEDERNMLETEKLKLAKLSSELQRVNQELKLNKERLIRAQVIARVGNLEYSVSKNMLWGSPEALRILGVDTPESEFPLSLMENIIPNFSDFRKDLENCMRNNREYDRELTIQRFSDGEEVVLHAKAEVVRNSAGDAIKIIGAIQDVSDRKKAEREKRHLEEKLARSKKMESLGLLAGGVAHDLNNVLSAMVGYPDMLLKDLPGASPMTVPLQRIQESSQKAAAIVQDLLTLARRGVTNHRVMNLNDIIIELMSAPELSDIQTWHPKVSFETHLDPDLLNINGSEVHLKKTILNLISNAAEALPAGGKVQIITENVYVEAATPDTGEIPEGDYVVLQVEDNGIGISPEDLSQIFEPFYTKKKMGRSGTGLGMSVVWGTVQDHKGYIQVKSTEGIGTQITVYLPLTRDLTVEREHVVTLDEYVGKGETILVVDDMAEQRELAENMLTRLGYEVRTADGGESALEMLCDRPADLIILDMIMTPGIDGLDTYIQILKSHPDQRAIIVSGYSENDRVRKTQKLGAKIYVRKPYTLEKLGMAVWKALNS